MKKIFRLLNAAALVAGLSVAFTACDPDTEKPGPIVDVVETDSISFENVLLDSIGIWNGSDKSGSMESYESWGSIVHSYSGGFNSGILTCPNVFYQDQTYLSTWWSGIACSNNKDTLSVGYGNQYSVFANSGATGSEKFALVGSDSATCTFQMPVVVKSMMVNNSTYVYWALKDGNDGAGYVSKFTAGDYFQVTVIGYDSTNVRTGQVVVPLADFRDSKTYICKDWTKISLESLGKVKTLQFAFTSTDTGVFGMNTPAYFCIDNIVYEKK